MPFDAVIKEQAETCARTRFIANFAEKMGMEYMEASQFLINLTKQDEIKDSDPIDQIELILAVNMNAKLQQVQGQARFKRFKFLLNNGNRRATNLARLWMDQKITFKEMLAPY